MSETTNMLQANVDLDGQVYVSVPLAALPALINALLRLCTHAQLGEVVVPRRAGEWERRKIIGGERSYRRDDDNPEDLAGSCLCVGESWRGWAGNDLVADGVTRAEAEAAVDERLRADGVVLP